MDGGTNSQGVHETTDLVQTCPKRGSHRTEVQLAVDHKGDDVTGIRFFQTCPYIMMNNLNFTVQEWSVTGCSNSEMATFNRVHLILLSFSKTSWFATLQTNPYGKSLR